MILLNKPIGKTPLEAIEEMRNSNPELKNTKLGYAGRLDPMAEGLLLVLVGDENKNKEKYQNLDKEYECEVLFGVETDTYDVLGVISPVVIPGLTRNLPREILNLVQDDIEKLVGEHVQLYPPYSSKAVDGKPLHWWARQNKLHEIKIPSRKITIYSIKVIEFITIKKENLKSIIFDRINLVQGDFRQEEIKKRWEKFFAETKQVEFTIAKLHVHCSSGTYVRSIAHELGKSLGTGAIALNIKRTKIGSYSL